jgi:hypothetical protein
MMSIEFSLLRLRTFNTFDNYIDKDSINVFIISGRSSEVLLGSVVRREFLRLMAD